MNCENLRIRSKKYVKFFYCKLKDKEISIELCKDCEDKEYIKRTVIKGKKHKQTKETEIQKYVKEAVWYRDKKKCIFCHKKVTVFFSNAHLIPRSAGGLGIEENIFTACDECHREQDNGLKSKEYTDYAENYLKGIYGANWDKKKLVYKKNMGGAENGII